MGSAQFACPSLDAVLADPRDRVVAIVTQPDRPQGRNREMGSCPVRSHIGTRSINVLGPESINAPESIEALAKLKPDLIVVVAYGQILKPDVLSLAPDRVINLHASLLPKYRGAAPIAWAIANGETMTGVTTMMVNPRMDAGDIIFQRSMLIQADDTTVMLHDRLGRAGARLLVETIDQIRDGRLVHTPQDETAVTLAPKLKKNDSRIDWHMPATMVANRVRAFIPWPGSWCELPRGSGHMLRIWRAQVDDDRNYVPGTVYTSTDELVIQAGQGALRVLEVQPEGRKQMSIDAFLRGTRFPAGTFAG